MSINVSNRNEEYRVPITATVSESTVEWFKDRAKKSGMPFSRLVDRAMSEYRDQYERVANDPFVKRSLEVMRHIENAYPIGGDESQNGPEAQSDKD